MRLSLSKSSFAIILTIIGLALFSATAQAQTYVFNQATFNVGHTPEAMAVGDLNGDGKPDLAVVSNFDGTLSILLGKADGTFQPHVDYPLSSSGGVTNTGVVTGDFNGDGRLDLAVTMSVGLSYEVAIFLGNGDGTFTKPTIFALDGPPQGLAVGDFNNDGKLDLAVAESTGGGSTGAVAILLGNGDGTFQPPSDFPLPAIPGMVVAADLNNDGNLDLIVATGSSNAFSVLLGNGNGTFQPYVDYSTSGSVGQLVVGDFNGDKKLDVVVPATAYGQTGFWIFPGIGDGTFQAPVNVTAGGDVVNQIVAGDFNGDGKLDVAFTTSITQVPTTVVLLGNGDGTFQTQPIVAGASATLMATGDFNGDGKLDLAYIPPYYYDMTSVDVMLGNGDGTFSLRNDYSTSAAPLGATAGDFNGDGKPDLAVVENNGQFSAGALSVFINNGGGTFQSPVDYAVGDNPQVAITGDFNGDGVLDVAVLNAGASIQQGTVSVLLGNGNGTFQTHLDSTVGVTSNSMVTGDFNGDGKLDLAAVSGIYSSSSGWQGAIAILLGNGNGTFQAPSLVAVPNTSQLCSLAVGDFNHDGKIDLAVSDCTSNVYVLLGNGNGTFASPVAYPVYMPGVAAAADFNGDGNIDLAVASSYNGFVYILLGKGDGTFQSAVSYSAGSNLDSLIVADFNGDGIPDMAIGDSYMRTAIVLLGNGDGTFGGPLNFPPAGNFPLGLAEGDFNGDGAADLAMVNGWYSSTVSVYLSHPVIALYPPKVVFTNEGEGTTSPAQTLTVSNPGSVPFGLSSIAATSPFAETNTCGTAVALGANCAISVTFSPSGTGETNGALTLEDSALGSPQAIPLMGLSVSGAAVTLSPASLSFDGLPVGQTSAAVTASLENTGNAALTGITIAATGDFTQSNTCGSSLGLGASCTISVKFVPFARGVRDGSITVTSNAGQSAISLSGIGLAAVLTLSTTSLDLGAQFVGITGGYGTVTVTSAGDLTLSITSIPATGDFDQTNDCNQPLAPGSSCYVNVSITPTAVGTRTGSLTFVDNGVGTQPSVALTATVTYAVPQIVSPMAPASAPPGSPGFTLTVNGSGFAPVSVVQWKNSPLPTTYVSPTQLTAAIPASDVASAGTALVTVVNPTPGGGTSNAVPFEITTGTPSVAFDQSTISVGQFPEGVAEADLNGDGKPDLIVANLSSNTVSVLLGNGDGTFQPPVNYSTNEGPASVVIADFNNDGKPDLAVVSTGCPLNGICGASSISIFLGNGDGTFQAPLTIPSTSYLNTGFAAADFNGDGKLDLAVGMNGISGGGIQIYLGNGDGTFQTGAQYQVGEMYSPPPTSIVVGDFNRDGKLDLTAVSPYGSNSVFILLGNGDGTFQSAHQYPTGPEPYSLVEGDFNGDGILDLATANSGTDANSVSVLLGNGDGTFQTNVDYATGTNPIGITAADFNGDGNLDIAVSNYNTNNVSILLGNGDGTFEEHQDFPTGVGPYGLAAADFNGDGRMDLAVADSLDNNVSVLLQVPLGPLPAAGLSTSSLTFSGQGLGTTSSAQSVTVSNTGKGALTIARIVATGDFAQTNNCGSSLAAGGSCTINVTFTPTATGTRSGSLIITDNSNGLTGTVQNVALSGTGLAPVASLFPTTLTFSGQNVGSTSSSQAVTLNNTGGEAMTITSIVASRDFAQTNNCGSSVAAGGNCTINVTFTPTQGGNRSGAITITDNAPGSPHAVALAGTGEDFTLGVPSGGSSTASVSPGGSASYTLSSAGLGGLNQTVNFTCTGAPSEATCTLNPTSATSNGSGSVSVTVTVTTTAPSAAPPDGRRAPPRGPGRELQLVWLLLLVLLTMVGWGLASERRFPKSLRWAVAMGAVAALALAMAACGGGGTVPTNPGTPAGTYTLTVTGTAGSGSTALQHSTTLTLTVT